MKLTELSIKKLFGYLEYKIRLSQGENITIIHGPNGCGKTTVLELLSALFRSDYETLSRIPFETLGVRFSDSGRLHLSKTIEDFHIKPTRKIDRRVRRTSFEYSYSKRGVKRKTWKTEYPSQDHREWRININQLASEIPELERIGPSVWLDTRTLEKLSSRDILALYSDQFPLESSAKTSPEWLNKALKSVDIHFIRSQRLVRRAPARFHEYKDSPETTDTIEIYAMELGKIVSEKLAESVSISQSFDRTFPSRLLDQTSGEQIQENELRDRYAKIEEKRRKMMSTGLIEEEQGVPLPGQKMGPMEKKVLSLYLSDTDDKLRVFDDLQRKLSAFTDIINAKMGKTKTMSIDRRKGFFFRSSVSGNPELTLKALSSGEQHQIVLFYELLFKTHENAVILIDEPEISLHVEWQRQFLKDLTKVTSLSRHSFIIATHAPQIVHDRWDLAFPLSGGIKNV